MIKRISISILLLIAPLSAFSQSCPTISVCFTPGQNCTAMIVDLINHADKSVLVQAYSFTSAPIAKAVVKAKKRGLDVRVILDKSQRKAKYSSATFLRNQGVPTWIDYKPTIAHNKVMIIDGELVITGSFNFTKAAQKRNAENVLVIRDSRIANKYKQNWIRRVNVSERSL